MTTQKSTPQNTKSGRDSGQLGHFSKTDVRFWQVAFFERLIGITVVFIRPRPDRPASSIRDDGSDSLSTRRTRRQPRPRLVIYIYSSPRMDERLPSPDIGKPRLMSLQRTVRRRVRSASFSKRFFRRQQTKTLSKVTPKASGKLCPTFSTVTQLPELSPGSEASCRKSQKGRKPKALR
jgi:hypothetical protein